MKPFSLKIVTPDGVQFDGTAEELTVRTTDGDVGILAGHINFAAALGMGEAMVVTEGRRRYGACIGGMVSVVDGNVTLLPTTFEWAEDIDGQRAEASYQRAKDILDKKDASDTQILMAKARLRRALVRQGVASRK